MISKLSARVAIFIIYFAAQTTQNRLYYSHSIKRFGKVMSLKSVRERPDGEMARLLNSRQSDFGLTREMLA